MGGAKLTIAATVSNKRKKLLKEMHTQLYDLNLATGRQYRRNKNIIISTQ